MEEKEEVSRIDGLTYSPHATQRLKPLSYTKDRATPHLTYAQRRAAKLEARPAKLERRKAKREEMAKDIQRKGDIIRSQQHGGMTRGSYHQSANTIRLHLETILEATKHDHSGTITLENLKVVRKEVLLALKGLALSAEAGERYSVEVLLHRLPASRKASHPGPKTEFSLRTHKVDARGMQTQPSDSETTGLDSEVIKLGLPTSDNRSPATRAAFHSTMPQDIAHTHNHSKAIADMELFTNGVRVNLPVSNPASTVTSTPDGSNTS